MTWASPRQTFWASNFATGNLIPQGLIVSRETFRCDAKCIYPPDFPIDARWVAQMRTR
jgi:hypothetical protein